LYTIIASCPNRPGQCKKCQEKKNEKKKEKKKACGGGTKAGPVGADPLDVHEPDHEEGLHDVREQQQEQRDHHHRILGLRAPKVVPVLDRAGPSRITVRAVRLPGYRRTR
jgi:hypothetical protein